VPVGLPEFPAGLLLAPVPAGELGSLAPPING